MPLFISTLNSLIKFEERKIKAGYSQNQMNRICQISNRLCHQLIDIHLSKPEIEQTHNLSQKFLSKLADLKIIFEKSYYNSEQNAQTKRKLVDK